MYEIAKYDPLLFKLPKGVVSKNNKVAFFVEYKDLNKPNIAYFMLKRDEDSDYKYLEMTKVEDVYFFEYDFVESGHYWYNFQFVFDGYCLYLNRSFDTRSYVSEYKADDYLQLVTEKEYDCTNSMQGGIIYQIFVDRFCKVGEVKNRKPLTLRDDWGGSLHKNTTDPIYINLEVFGGNFKGIVSKLDYLKNLGVTTIYLNPIQLANSNHKYNTSDYMRVDDMYGTESDFKNLVDEAKKQGMQIVIDGVYNHTGSDSIYFNKDGNFDTLGAYRSPKSRYYNWFNFIEYPDKYYSWWGIDTLPSINHECDDFQDYITGENGVIDKFMKLGVGGVRLDVVDEITDRFVKKIENRVHKYGKDKVVMGEVWENAAIKESYSTRRKYFADNELNSVMNYPIKETILEYIRTKSPVNLESTIRMLENDYPKVVRDNLMNFLTTHDTTRMFSELLKSCEDDEVTATNLYKIATALMFTLPGVPSIFYGDEYGMQDNCGSSRGCFDWDNYKNEVYAWFEKLTKIRKFAVMKDGEINVLYSKHGKFIFERFNDNERIIVMTNLEDSNLNIEFKGEFKSFLTGKKVKEINLGKNQVEIIIETK